MEAIHEEKNMMKFFSPQILLVVSIIACKAEQRETSESNTVACPTEFKMGTHLPESTQVFGQLPKGNFPLRSAGINLGNTADPKERVFSEEILEDWVQTPDSTYLLSEYPASHEVLTLKCNYAAKGTSASDSDPNSTVLLIPLPQGKSLKCTFVRKNRWKAASCSVGK
ncbi:MAG: hypothetical protein ABIW76_22385 [Fibrobacteria bacterium]